MINVCFCFSILLLCIAILSAYSIHLLLRSAGVVGKMLVFHQDTYLFTKTKNICSIAYHYLRCPRNQSTWLKGCYGSRESNNHRDNINTRVCVCVLSGIRAYEQLGHRAFGQSGKVLAGSIITMHNIGGKVQYVTSRS